MKTCHEISDLLSAYVDGELIPIESRQIRDHVDGCASCAEELGRLERMELLIRTSLEPEPAEAPGGPEPLSRVHRRLDSERRPAARRLAWAAGILALAVGGWMFLSLIVRGPAPVEGFLKQYASAPPSVRVTMRKEVAGWNEARHRALLAALEQPSLEVQRSAREILQDLADQQSIRRLLWAPVEPASGTGNEEILAPLGTDPSDLEAIPSLVMHCFIQDGGQDMAQKALAEIAVTHRTVVTDHLLPLLKSPDAAYVRRGVEILARSGSRIAVPQLIELLDAPHLSKHAREILRDIAVKYSRQPADFGTDADGWEKWYRRQKWAVPESEIVF